MAFEIAELGPAGVVEPEAPATTPDEPRSDAVTTIELRKLLHAERATFYRWEKQGRFRRLEIPLGRGTRKRYSRKLVMAFLNGEISGRRSA